MNFYLVSLFSLSVAPAAVAGFVRRKKIDASYAPFLWLLWAGLVNELLSFFLILQFGNNYYNHNLFVLLEAVLLCTFFKRQGVFDDRRWLYVVLVGLFGTCWAGEQVFAPPESFQSYSLIFFSLVFALLSIHQMNQVIFLENHSLWRNACFLLCLAFVVYYTSSAVVEVFLLAGLGRSALYQLYIYDIFLFINVLVNLLYFFAVLWMPMKRRLLLQPSTS
jgi:hypothetical protein